MLAERVLKGVSDTRAISDHKPGRFPVDELLDDYNEIAAHIDELPNLEPIATGRQLKDAINMMEPKDQIRLLYKYLQRCGELPDPTAALDTDENENQKLRLWVIVAVVMVVLAVILLLAGGVVVLAVREGHASNPAFDGLLHTAKEILDILVGRGSDPSS